LLALVAACYPASQPIGYAHAQLPGFSPVLYPDPANASVDGQVFEYH
jgi:hypothetical protein